MDSAKGPFWLTFTFGQNIEKIGRVIFKKDDDLR